MWGNVEGTPDEKLERAAAFVASYVPEVECELDLSRRCVVLRAARIDGVAHVEEVPLEPLAYELLRHAAMCLGRAVRAPDAVGNWERWASAWHLLQIHGPGALAHADAQIILLRSEGAPSGVEIWEDLRRRIAVLEARPEAWLGRA